MYACRNCQCIGASQRRCRYSRDGFVTTGFTIAWPGKNGWNLSFTQSVSMPALHRVEYRMSYIIRSGDKHQHQCWLAMSSPPVHSCSHRPCTQSAIGVNGLTDFDDGFLEHIVDGYVTIKHDKSFLCCLAFAFKSANINFAFAVWFHDNLLFHGQP